MLNIHIEICFFTNNIASKKKNVRDITAFEVLSLIAEYNFYNVIIFITSYNFILEEFFLKLQHLLRNRYLSFLLGIKFNDRIHDFFYIFFLVMLKAT